MARSGTALLYIFNYSRLHDEYEPHFHKENNARLKGGIYNTRTSYTLLYQKKKKKKKAF
jgi:hypothetical protein